MAKKDVWDQAVASGVVASDADPDQYTVEELRELLSGEVKVERKMAAEPIVAADGHVVLSQEDIDART